MQAIAVPGAGQGQAVTVITTPNKEPTTPTAAGQAAGHAASAVQAVIEAGAAIAAIAFMIRLFTLKSPAGKVGGLLLLILLLGWLAVKGGESTIIGGTSWAINRLTSWIQGGSTA